MDVVNGAFDISLNPVVSEIWRSSVRFKVGNRSGICKMKLSIERSETKSDMSLTMSSDILEAKLDNFRLLFLNPALGSSQAFSSP